MEFERLRHGNLTVQEYYLKFISLSRYTPHMVADMRATVRRFVLGLKPELYRDAKIVAQNDKMTISMILAFVQASAPVLKFRNDKKKNFRPPSSYSQASMGQSTYTIPVCSKCSKRNLGECRMGTDACYGCGQKGHIQRDYPSARQGIGGYVVQSTNSAIPRNN
ncbi:uncharacterized protein LOC132631290 [Lycium barbarum]|uniref:uncharacterized protein LOC132631290 n=1 Tax=Lycium barbarum TaxID=112863 RepID=UPI00293EAC96|nr:uncharacterized protein LOC132631290 [Lycium barbarum]